MTDIVFELDRLDGHAFEDAVAVLFERLGYAVTRTPKSGDEGRDLILQSSNGITIVECKHQSNVIGRPVVQKLHSAVATYPAARRGVIVTTSTFSSGAVEYVRKLNNQGEVEIELLDFHALIDLAKPVGVYFTSKRQNMSVYFHVPWRAQHEVVKAIRRRHLSRLVSFPRSVQDVAEVRVDAQEIMPVLLVSYRIDKVFSTQAGVIHKVSECGARVHDLAGSCFKDLERDYWLSSEIREYNFSSVQGKQLPTYFGKSPSQISSNLRSEIARKHTSTVRYAGKNNQYYSKHCEIKPAEVHTSAQQVLLTKWRVSLLIGPKRYELTLADDAKRDLLITSASSAGSACGGKAFASTDGVGIICNECAEIVPSHGSDAGLRCAHCAMTLCRTHHWRYPRPLFFSWSSYCSSCYLALYSDAVRRVPIAFNNVVILTLLSCVSGLPFLIAGRPLACVMVSSVSVFVLFFGFLNGYLLLASLLYVAINIGITSYWWTVIEHHFSNLQFLAAYKPEWINKQFAGSEYAGRQSGG